MSHKTTTHWKGGMQFESDNPSGKTVLMDTVVKGQEKQFGVISKSNDVICLSRMLRHRYR